MVSEQNHINGWPVLETFLVERGMRQGELAKLLGVSAPAISQIKHERMCLSSAHLAKLVDYFQMSRREAAVFYAMVISSRVLRWQPESCRGIRLWPRVKVSQTALPVISCRSLMWFQPALESCTDFARRYLEYELGKLVRGASLAVRVNEYRTRFRLPSDSLILLGGDDYPRDGQLVLARLHNRPPALYYYRSRNGAIELQQREFGSEELKINDMAPLYTLAWAYPVRSILLDSRRP